MKARKLYGTLCILLALALSLCAVPALACTGYYVGRNASADGSVMIGRICDTSPQFSLVHLGVTPRVENEPGRMVGSFLLPDTTWKCVSLYRGSAFMSGVNEKGVTCSGPLSTYDVETASVPDAEKRTYAEAVPEMSFYELALITASTAEEAVRTLCDLYDRYGNFSLNCTMFADSEEAWYLCPYSNNQYCAVRLPDDTVGLYGNMPMLETVNPESPDVICSPGLFSIPEKYGFAVYDEDGRMNLFKTYAGGILLDYSNLRTWRGHQLMAPSTAGEYDSDTMCPLSYSPDRKVSLEDLSAILRDRYEGTEFCPETSGRHDVRPIAYSHTSEAVILQTKPDLPAEISGTMWTCMSNTEFAPLVPVSAATTEIPESYLCSDADTPDATASWPLKAVYGLCVLDRERYGANIRAYWEQEDARRFAMLGEKLEEARALYESDPGSAKSLIDGVCAEEMRKAYADSQTILSELLLYIADACGDQDWMQLNYDTASVQMNPPTITPFKPFEKRETFITVYGHAFTQEEFFAFSELSKEEQLAFLDEIAAS